MLPPWTASTVRFFARYDPYLCDCSHVRLELFFFNGDRHMGRLRFDSFVPDLLTSLVIS
jgi:hypothetical protein